MTIGQIIRTERKNQNMTQKNLAAILNVAQNTITQWENGSNQPKLAQLTEIAKALRINPYLFLPDAWGFLEKNEPENIEAMAKELSKIQKENEQSKIVCKALDKCQNDFIKSTSEIEESQIKKMVADKLILLNRKGLLSAYNHVNELTKIKEYRK